MAQQGILIVISGPSGTGKGTICRELLRNNPQLKYSVSVTTRKPRAGEVDGVNYFFTSRERFINMIEDGELLEWAEVYGNFYGTPRCYVQEQLIKGHDIVLEIDTQGAMKVKKNFPEAVYVYIIPPSLDELAVRINKRGTDSSSAIEHRLDCAVDELTLAQNYHYIVVNDQVALAVQRVETIITAEKYRSERNSDLINSLRQTKCT